MYKPCDVVRSGIPDWIICFYGIFVVIELKVPGNEPTSIQALTLTEIRKAGGRTAVCHSAQEVMQFLDEVMRSVPIPYTLTRKGIDLLEDTKKRR